MSPLFLVFLLVGTGLCAPIPGDDSLLDLDTTLKAVVGGKGGDKGGSKDDWNDNQTNKDALLDVNGAVKAVVGGNKGADKDCDKKKGAGKGNPLGGEPNDLEKTVNKETSGITKDTNGLKKETDGLTKDINGVQKDADGLTKDIGDEGKQKDGATKDADDAGQKAGKDCDKGKGLGDLGGDKGGVGDLLGDEKKANGGDDGWGETGLENAAETEEGAVSENDVQSNADKELANIEVNVDAL